ncbi:MAG TPA: diguanylate cyclase, partial [Pseudomonadales bacterium]|nr:diguanylate cyclase [Pseudomonadales bacterium]
MVKAQAGDSTQAGELPVIFDQLQAAIYVKDERCRYTYMNIAARKVLNVMLDDVRGCCDSDLFPEDVARYRHDEDLRVMHSGESLYREECVDVAGNEQPLYFWTVKQPLRDAAGKVSGMMGMSLDIKALKDKEQEITALKKHYSAILHALPDPMFEVDLNGRYLVSYSPRPELLAAPPDELIGRSVEEVLPAREAEICLRAIREAQESGYSSGHQFQLALPGGSRWFELSVARKQTETDGEPRFIALSRDISERKEAENALKKQESLLRAIVDNTPLEFWARDLEGRCILENAEVVKHWGSMLGSRPEEFDVTEEELAIWLANNARAYAGEVVSNEITYNIEGQERIFHNVVAPVRVDDKIVAIVGYNFDITERKLAEQKIRNLAFYDPLTNLPNRRLMFERLAHAQPGAARRQNQGALLLIDLDNFKQLNDSMGHEAGDKLLVEVAGRLKAGIRHTDTAARLGGDEFVVILEDLDPGTAGVMQAERIAVQLQTKLNDMFRMQMPGDEREFTYHCSSSIGIALFHDESVSSEELLRRADTAMYQAKSSGRNNVRFFDPDMQAAVASRVALESDLRKAIDRGQFVLHFQPQVNGAGEILGAEALLRWHHPSLGTVNPSEFIPVAEDTGLVIPLGRWVLEEACRCLAAWARQPALSHLRLSVNVSARQFQQMHFTED